MGVTTQIKVSNHQGRPTGSPGLSNSSTTVTEWPALEQPRQTTLNCAIARMTPVAPPSDDIMGQQ
jgi:hypothetical protein